jgi:signal transduction histidine kinase
MVNHDFLVKIGIVNDNFRNFHELFNLIKMYRFLLILVTLGFTQNLFSQRQNEQQFLVHKNKYLEIIKEKPSLARDNKLVVEVDQMIHHSPNFNLFKNFSAAEIEILKNYLKNNKSKNLKSAHINLAIANSTMVFLKPIEALKYFFEADKIFEDFQDPNCQILCLLRTSAAFTYYTKSNAGLPYITKAIKVAVEKKDTFLLSQALTYQGDYFMNRSEYEKALPFFERIAKLKEKNELHYFVNNFNFGLCYYKTGREKEGITLLENTVNELPKNDYKYVDYQIAVREDLIKIYLEKNSLAKANEHLKLMKYYSDYPNIYKNDSLRYSLYDYQIQKGLGNYKMALKHLENRRIFEDSTKKTQIEQQVAGIKAQLELKNQNEKLQKIENEKLKAENEREMQLRWLLIGLSILGVFSTLYVIRTNKKLKENNKELIDKNREITQAHLKGQTTERQRVAIDLHDNLGSTISSIKYSLEAIDRSKMNADEVAVQENLYSLLDKAYNDVRLLSHNLLPEEFEKKGLTETLTEFIRKINKASKIKFELKIDENFGRQDQKIEFELYSICMELVNNIMKHSKATQARITLSKQTPPLGAGGLMAEQILLLVSDNGIGIFNNDSDGKGMKNIQARVDSINGKWTVKSVEGEGVVNEILV